MRFRCQPQHRRVMTISITLLLLWLVVPKTHAQIVIDNLPDTSLRRLQIQFNQVGANINSLLLNTFYLLALIEFSWSMIKSYLDNQGLQRLLKTLVTRILFIGFFTWLLQRGSATATEIFRSFEQLAVATGTTDGSISPSDVFDRGQDLFARLVGEATDMGVFTIIFDDDVGLSDPVVLIFIGMITFVVMAILAAHFAVVLLETFVAAAGGIILLALGSSRWTYQYAVSYLKYALSVGMKLFIFTIIVGLTLDEVNRFFALTAIDSFTNLTALLSFVLFAALLAILAPKSVKGMMDGVSIGSGATAASALSVAGAGAKMVSRSTGQISKSLLPKQRS